MSTIIYVDKSELKEGQFGVCLKDDTIKIREDLPNCVKDFLIVHETYHISDKATNWIIRELKANWIGFKKHPIGFLVTMIMSLSLCRWKYYWQRFKERK